MRYRCPKCGYAQDFEPTAENNKKCFPEFPDLKSGECPSCRKGRLELEKEK